MIHVVSMMLVGSTVVVDLQQAVLLNESGQRARVALRAERERMQAEVDRRKDEVLVGKERWSEERFEQERQAFNDFIKERESALRAREEMLLAPILNRLNQRVAALRAAGHRVLTGDRTLMVNVPSACDLTERVARNESPGVSVPEACARRVVVTFDVGRALAGTPEAERATQALDELRDERQTVLAELRSKVQEAEHPEEKKRLRATAQERFTTFQRELEEVETATEERLRRDALTRLASAAARSGTTSRAVFVVEATEPDCDGTEAIAAVLRGKPLDAPLGEACPALREAGGP
ncbi:MAG: OmpH family outer membrane protein [Myxococcota bacterium]